MSNRFKTAFTAANAIAAMAFVMPGVASAHTGEAPAEDQGATADQGEIAALRERLAALEAKVGEGGTADAKGAVVSLRPGLSVASADGKTTFAIDGRVMVDAGWVLEDGAVDIGDDTDIRHLWFGMSGKSGEWRYKLQTSIDNNALGVKDAYVAYDGIKNVPVMIGNFYENNGVENMSGNLNTTMMEGSSGIGAFRTLRHVGISVDPHGENWGAQIGLFGDGVSDAAAGTDDEGWAFAARATAAPVKTDAMLAHVGGSWRQRTPNAPTDQVRFRGSGGSHVIGETLVDTGNIGSVENYTTSQLEGILRIGAVTLSSEYSLTDVSRSAGGDASFSGGYVTLGWMLTGEARDYNAKRGTVGKLKPASPFSFGGGGGAWEIAARYDTLDLTDGPVSGGEMDTITLGVNWYPTANARIMLNYVMNDLDSTGPVAFRDSDPDYLMIRVQADF